MKIKAFTLIELLIVVSIISVLAAIALPNFLEAQTRTKISRVQQDLSSLSASLRAYQSDYHAYPPHLIERQRFLEACLELGVVDSTTISTPGDVGLPWVSSGYVFGADAGMMGMWGMGMNQDSMVMFGEDGSTTETLSSQANMPEEKRTVPLNYWEYMGAYPVMDYSGYDLYPLTTPVAYFSHQLPRVPFCENSSVSLFYVNLYDLKDQCVEGLLPSNKYILLSWGPDYDQDQPDFENPVKGPFIPYDPTNGTVSNGDIYLMGE
jgi:prepilin-type N-terminal cleavage/methylation domain-containing protein